MKLIHYSETLYEEIKHVVYYFNNLLPRNVYVYLNDVDENCKTCVRAESSTYWCYETEYRLKVSINTKDVLTYANMNNINYVSAGKLLFGHEIMHVALGHFSDIYKDYDKELLNIAGDLEINSILGIKHPGIVPQDFNLPQYLDTKTYYKLLEAQRKNNPDRFKQNKEKSQSGIDAENPFSINNELQEGGANSNVHTTFINFDKNGTSSTDKNENVQYNGNQISSITQVFTRGTETATHKKDYSKIIGSDIKGLSEILRKLTQNENTYSIIPTSKKSSYQKFNNRRNSDFILPGKKIVQSGCNKKFKNKMTVFMDISGSTSSIEKSMHEISQRLHDLGADIVFYDSHYKDTLKPSEQFCHLKPAGGTDVKVAIKEYMTTNKCKLERLYIFTDGADDFTKLGELCQEYHIYRINPNEIRELSEKEITKSSYY